MQPTQRHTAFIAGYSDINIKPMDIKSGLASLGIKGVTNIDIPTKRWKGYGFIEFSDSKSLNDFIKQKRLIIKNREIQVKKHKSGFELKKEKKLTEKRRIFVQNIPLQWADENLLEVFLPQGEVEECYVLKKAERGPKRINKKVGYVLFTQIDDALRLIAMEKIELKGETLLIKKSRPRSSQAKQQNSGRKRDSERPPYKNSGNSFFEQIENKNFRKSYQKRGRGGRVETRIREFYPGQRRPHEELIPQRNIRRPVGAYINSLDFHGESQIINRKSELFFHRLKPCQSDYFEFRKRNGILEEILIGHQLSKDNLMLNKIINLEQDYQFREQAN